MDNVKIAKELLAVAKELTASKKTAGSGMFTVSDDVEVVYYPFEHLLQIGMGGEWWSGTIEPGKNVFHHKKEGGDPAYRPVIVKASVMAKGMTLHIGGGFGYETIVRLVFK